MRSSILLSAMIISPYFNEGKLSYETTMFLAVCLLAFFVVDTIEFLFKISRK